MVNMRKFMGLMVLLVAAMAVFSGMASATSNKANGTVVTGTNVGSVALNGVVTCHSSHISGSLTNFAGAGVTISISTAHFTNCTPSGSTVAACSLPWDMHTTTSTDGGNTWHGNITGVCVDVTTSLTGACRYTGSLTGVYVESTDRLHVSTGQGLTSETGGFCPTNGSVTATYATTPTDLNIS